MSHPFKPFDKRVRRAAILDYFSMTWCPEQLKALRKLAASQAKLIQAKASGWTILPNDPLIIPGWFEQKDIDAINDGLNIGAIRDMVYKASVGLNLGELDLYCDNEIKRFFEEISLFWGKYAELYERDKGMFGYKRSWNIVVDGTIVGIAASGARNGGCFLSITGAGCGTMDPEATYNAISGLPMIKITRVDVAYDCYNGEFDLRFARKAYKNGLFATKGKYPDGWEIRHFSRKVTNKRAGRAKVVGNKKGDTFYVGSRTGGNLMRIYQKGRQLQGQGVSTQHENWVRWEWELRAKDREIPLMILLKPEEYLAASYPVMTQIMTRGEDVDLSTARITTTKKEVRVIYEVCEANARNQVGSMINVMKDAKGLSDSEIVARLRSPDPNKVPKRLYRAVNTQAA